MTQIIWLLWGLIFGSAATALVYRIPRGISWWKGRSMCPQCKHTLAWYDLIPILSYLALGGKCRYCHQRISIKYFLIEIAMALGFVYLANWQLSAIWFFTVVIAFMDWETQLVSEVLVLIWGGLVILSNLSILSSPSHLLGLAVGVGVIGGLWAATRGRGMGFGDIEIAAVVGVWIGWPHIWVSLMAAFIIGAIYGLTLVILKKVKLKSEIAFGPFLIIGAWITYLWGAKLWSLLYGA